jgi:hypothetical protein
MRGKLYWSERLAHRCVHFFSGQIIGQPRKSHQTKTSGHRRRKCLAHTASFAAFKGRALTIFLAGLALNTVGSFANGLMPARALVAGFLMTTNFAKPGNRNAPFFFSSLQPTDASDSMTPLTSFFAREC